jgi:signal transduction histidine kinase
MRSRTTLTVTLLGASFLTTAFIAARGLITTIYQRTSAVNVIRDYAALAANELIQGAEGRVPDAGHLAAMLETRPLLPPAITRGRLTNRDIFVRLSDRGRTLFATPGAFDPLLGVRRTIDAGSLKGLTVETSFDRGAARLLIFGGVPEVNLLLYATILAINAGLLVTAVLQLRKERALARLRSDFISSVSHELRTPLTQIRMFSETLLLERVRSDAERRRSLSIIDQETRRLAHLVENILQFSRGERGTLQIVPSPHDLTALVREAVAAFTPIAAARGTTIELDLPESAMIAVDGDAMRQVLLNLLDNAVKFGPANQRVLIGLRGRELYVDDEGPGIPERERSKVFERYRRLEREEKRAIAGMGIGLSVVRELVGLHGGRVRIETGSRGGARFVVSL